MGGVGERPVRAIRAWSDESDQARPPIGPLPACYDEIRRRDPEATLLELPLQSSSCDMTYLDRTYWQSRHRLPTSAGYSGITMRTSDGAVVAWAVQKSNLSRWLDRRTRADDVADFINRHVETRDETPPTGLDVG